MQVHRIGDTLLYYSRNALEHGEQSGYRIFDTVIKQQIQADMCVLDGEIIVWNKLR